MCRVCDWGRHFVLADEAAGGPGSEKPGVERNSSRRSLLRATAGIGATIGATAALGKLAQAQSFVPVLPPPRQSDIVFSNGKVFTADAEHPWAEAVAVRGNTIIYVGNSAGAEPYLAPPTRVIDLKGRLLLPGFVEGHIHPIVGAAVTHGIDLQYDTREQTLQALKDWRDRNGKVDVVRGFGWRYSAFAADGPSKADLDELWPDTPVFLLAVDAHSGWVNSRALQLAKIGRDTPDPLPGFSTFKRGTDGEPTGWLIEVPAVLQVMQAAAPITREFIAQALEEWLPKAAAAGITSLFDAGIQIMPEVDGLQLYESLEQARKLPFRVVTCHYHNDPEDDPLPRARRLRDRARAGTVGAGVLKLNIDGVDAQYTAAMLDPYSDRPGTKGEIVFNAALLRDIVTRADAEGFDVHFHAIGDRAVRASLDAVQAAIRANGARVRRHTIAHCSLIDDSDLPRFAELGVIAQFSAQWAVPDPYWKQITRARWGDDRAAKTYRIGSLLRSRASVSLGTDWPAASHRSTFRPVDALEAANTRNEPGEADQAPLRPADERLTLEQALRANTIGAAHQLRLEKLVGSITVGKRADLVLLDRDIFESPPHQIHQAEVQLTMMNGVIRHEAKEAKK